MLKEIEEKTRLAVLELAQLARLTSSQLFVVGASSSEVAGRQIGTAGSEEIAEAIIKGILSACEASGFHIAIQCCEHLNRALVMERTTLGFFRLQEVMAVPVAKAGGAVATAAFRAFADPVLAETCAAHAGLDIGGTLIGMHLQRVAVPVRLQVNQIGQAHVTAARTRPPLIGGERAVYSRPI